MDVVEADGTRSDCGVFLDAEDVAVDVDVGERGSSVVGTGIDECHVCFTMDI